MFDYGIWVSMVYLQDFPFPVQMHAVNTDYLQDFPFPVQMHAVNKSNNKITEHRAVFQREIQNS